MTEDRLDRLERIVSSLADAVQANVQSMDRIGLRHEVDYERLRAEQAELRQQREQDEQDRRADDERLRAEQAELRQQREQDEQDWRDDRATMQRAITTLTGNVEALVETAQITFARVDQMQDEVTILQGQVTTLQGQTQDTINQVRDLQVQGNQIMERLDRGQR